jgi:hypothetical protein
MAETPLSIRRLFPQAIEKKLYTSGVFDMQKPDTMQNKVF